MSDAALTRRRLLQGAAAAASVAHLGPLDAALAARPKPRRRPNIVVILADDLGYGELGCYGQQLMQTPHSDRMAAEGTRYTDYYAGAAVCAPSRCCMLTGLHNGHARIRANAVTAVPPRAQDSLAPEDVTFAEVMQRGGYATGLFGKWGFGPDDRAPFQPADDAEAHPSWPLQKGFDEFVGFVEHGHAALGYYATYLWDGNERFDIPQNENDARAVWTPDVYFDRALEFVRRHRHRPFLLELAITLPHAPNESPTTEPYSDRPWSESTKKHAAQVTLLDSYVGRLLATIRKLSLDDDTIVLLTSDNGPHDEAALGGGHPVAGTLPTPAPTSAADVELFDANGPLRSSKGSLYEGGIRVPMIVRAPGRVPAGATSGVPWAAWDLLPTLADYARVTAPGDVDGRSVRALLSGRAQRRDGHLYCALRAADPGAIVAYPELLAPGTATLITTAGGYRLLRGSPALAAGVPVPDDGGRDFFGNRVPRGAPNIGAYQGMGVDGAAQAHALPALAPLC